MKIKWVNHASYILMENDVKLIVDPWIEGKAFNNGWELLSKTQMTYDDFKEITHIWFSHEHPDHFVPSNLKSIPQQYRKNIVVIYQKTKDKKIVSFCKELEFKQVIEVYNTWLKINDSFKIFISPYGNGDSWSYVKTGDKTVLNLNDCVIEKEFQVKNIKRIVGEIDVLLTQFSYASWAGNKDDFEFRKSQADEKLESVLLQCKILKPKFVIPFASYVWFCHKENYYMNDSINRIDKVYEFILRNTACNPVILYPNDVWFFGNGHNSSEPIGKYIEDYKKINENNIIDTKKVELQVLMDSGKQFINKLKEHNSSLLLRSLEVTKIYLTDYNKIVEFSLKHGLKEVNSQVDFDICDIALSSDSLLYCFKFLWGGGTLNVNGRFQKPKKGNFNRFYKYFYISGLNNQGINYNLFFIFRREIKRLFARLHLI